MNGQNNRKKTKSAGERNAQLVWCGVHESAGAKLNRALHTQCFTQRQCNCANTCISFLTSCAANVPVVSLRGEEGRF